MKNNAIDIWVLFKEHLKGNRHFALGYVSLRLIHAGKRNKVFASPILAVKLHQSGIGEQVDGTFKEVQIPSVSIRDTERILLLTAGTVAHNPCGIGSSVCGVLRLSVLIKADKDGVVIWERLKEKTFLQAVVDDFIVNPTPKQILCNLVRRLAFFGKQERRFRRPRFFFLYVPHNRIGNSANRQGNRQYCRQQRCRRTPR